MKRHPWKYSRLNQTRPQQPDLNWPCFEAGLQGPAGPFQLKLSNYSVISLLDGLSFVPILKDISGTASEARELLQIARYPGAGPSRAQHLSGIAGHKQFTCEHTKLLPASCAGDQTDPCRRRLLPSATWTAISKHPKKLVIHLIWLVAAWRRGWVSVCKSCNADMTTCTRRIATHSSLIPPLTAPSLQMFCDMGLYN